MIQETLTIRELIEKLEHEAEVRGETTHTNIKAVRTVVTGSGFDNARRKPQTQCLDYEV